MAIYTKRGDRGETSLYDEKNAQRVRVSKNSLVVEALGTIDELNSFLGVSRTFCDDKKLDDFIKEIQKNLLTIGSITAGSKLRFSKVKTKQLEKKIDDLEGSLPVLKNFILPGGSKLAAHLHYSRSLSRRTERVFVRLSKKVEVKEQVLIYLNRLSDTLFMLARGVNASKGVKDYVWEGNKK